MSTNLVKAVFAVVVTFSCATALRADSLDITLTQASQTVVQGTTVVSFDATVFNPSSSSETLYLNGDSWTTNSPLVIVDDSPFNANAPIDLAPGDSSGQFQIFNVDLSPSAAPDLYTGVFSILGGADGGAGTAFDDLADASFSLQVTNPVAAPEPGILLLLGSGLAGLALLRRRTIPI
jgi:hypothetical protein